MSHNNFIENYGFYKDCSNTLYENKESNIVWKIVWPEVTFLAKYHNNDSKSRIKDLEDINNPNILQALDITRLKKANISYIKKKNELQQDPMDYSIDNLIIKIKELK